MDLRLAGLRQSSVFWAYLTTLAASYMRVIGRLSRRAWREDQAYVARVLGALQTS